METAALAELHKNVAALGFTGDAETFELLIHKAECQSREAECLRIWSQVPGAKAMLERLFAHARRRGSFVSKRSNLVQRVIFFPDNEDQKVRLSMADLRVKNVVLYFSRGNKPAGGFVVSWAGKVVLDRRCGAVAEINP